MNPGDTLRALLEQHQEALVSGLYVQALADLEEYSRRLRMQLGRLEEAEVSRRAVESCLEGLLAELRGLNPKDGASRKVIALLEGERRLAAMLPRRFR